MSRKTDLEQLIRESYSLIRQYEAIILASSDPKEKARARQQIQEQQELIKGHLEKYTPLCEHLNQPMSADIVEIAVTFGFRLSHYENAGQPPSEAEQQLEHVTLAAWLLNQVRRALRDPIWQGIGALVAVVALAIAIGAWFWPDIRTLLIPTALTPTPAPTATVVRLTDARVHFTVVPGDDDEQDVSAGSTLILRPGDAALITVNVTVNQSRFPRPLAHHYFAPRGIIPEEHTGPKASYVAPEQPGPDVITVQITDTAMDDTILRSINVIVSEE
jgi:hypothetical protein